MIVSVATAVGAEASLVRSRGVCGRLVQMMRTGRIALAPDSHILLQHR